MRRDVSKVGVSRSVEREVAWERGQKAVEEYCTKGGAAAACYHSVSPHIKGNEEEEIR